ncbi:hypothetical protein AAMO2058_000959600 [Amorphochlora amoebiformis]|uniref:RING-type domain-containing protein n=1 Tax=Amorphochlora amoebiformis TaxID=1561963 RepID=A0A7S0DLL0_9EUKA|mmetsp:Transcript_33285/g.53470  ORF Transcript_33285/g.53470 Transcript_33285/m.53470 type:complete len:181 (+) Transcript_33285:68-610(+)
MSSDPIDLTSDSPVNTAFLSLPFIFFANPRTKLRPPSPTVVDLTDQDGEERKDEVEVVDVEQSGSSKGRKRRMERKLDGGTKRSKRELVTVVEDSNQGSPGDTKSSDPSQDNAKLISNLKSALTCGICQCTVAESKSPLASTTCGHLFCQKCIRKAVRITKKCPTCRKGLRLKDVHRVYF